MQTVQYKMKLPVDVKAWLAEQSAKNLRSQSNEIILAIREKMERGGGISREFKSALVEEAKETFGEEVARELAAKVGADYVGR